MINRIYLLLTAIAIFVMGLSSFYANSWLGSIGDPTIASDGFVFHSSFSWAFLWISFAVLAVFSLISRWQTDSVWPALVTFGYFAVSLLLLLYNDTAYSDFVADNSLTAAYRLLTPFYIAVIVLVIGVALVVAASITGSFRVKVVKKSKNADEPETPKVEEEKKVKSEE